LVGKSKSIELMIEGSLHEFEKGLELGVINYLWPAEEDGQQWWDRVMEYAWSFCPPHKASKAVGRIKRSVQSGWEVPIESGLALERELQQQLFQSDDAREGLDAYSEKRKPSFTGK
ncbi:MAG TPA: enoyl-CoA hydratase-related protein, partial [Thermoanaerobaculia bacterium]